MEDEGNDAWIGYGDPGGMGRRWKIGNVDKALPFFEDAYVEKLNEDGKPWCCQQSGGGCDRLAKRNVGVARTSHRNQDKTVQVNATRPSPYSAYVLLRGVTSNLLWNGLDLARKQKLDLESI